MGGIGGRGASVSVIDDSLGVVSVTKLVSSVDGRGLGDCPPLPIIALAISQMRMIAIPPTPTPHKASKPHRLIAGLSCVGVDSCLG